MSAVPGPVMSMLVGAAVFVGFVVWATFIRKAPAAPQQSPADAPWPEPAAPAGKLSPYRRALVEAGIVEPSAQVGFAALHATAPVGGALGGLWIAIGTEATGTALATMAALGGWIGWWLPRSWLQSRRTQRRSKIQ